MTLSDPYRTTWVRRSRHDASLCARCSAAIAPAAPVKITRAYFRFDLYGREAYPRLHKVTLCSHCATDPGARIGMHAGAPLHVPRKLAPLLVPTPLAALRPCQGCGRPLDGHYGDLHVACCGRCLGRCHGRTWRSRHRAPAAARGRPCATCGAVFTPRRSDARTCSDACRQKAHRRRQRAAKVRGEDGGDDAGGGAVTVEKKGLIL
jgi:hypothetical protein